VADDAQVRDLVAFALERFGTIDVLYNNAGAARFAPIQELELAQWHFTLRNEVDAVFLPTRHVVPTMVERRSGSIINTGSVAGMIGTDIAGLPIRGGVAHCAAKGAVLAMTRALAQELGPHGIRVNSVSPGLIDTPALTDRLSVAGARDAGASVALLQRLGTAEDVAPCALFLASDESSFVTGANFVVDGGWTAH
jgi:NAD(P)-dependent dehydrogenase (short-subunit alcohol dehydrogenase family)